MENKMKRWPLIATFLLFVALCVSAAYWAMQLFQPSRREVSAPPLASYTPPKLDAAAALFGGYSAAAVASNFQLKGVVVASEAADSVAILSANGKPAQAIRTNREIIPGVIVHEVQRDHVLLSEGGVIKRVELPANTMKKVDAMTSPAARSSGPPPVSRAGFANPPNLRDKDGSITKSRHLMP